MLIISQFSLKEFKIHRRGAEDAEAAEKYRNFLCVLCTSAPLR
jgi:hypothetical protein